MQLETLKCFLGTCSLLNLAFLFVWLGMYKSMGNLQYKMLNYFYEVDKKELSLLNLKLMSYYKVATFMFFVMPYIALQFV